MVHSRNMLAAAQSVNKAMLQQIRSACRSHQQFAVMTGTAPLTLPVYRKASKFPVHVDLPVRNSYLLEHAAGIPHCSIINAPAFSPPIRAGRKSGSQDVSGKQARPIGADQPHQPEDLPKYDI